MRKSTNVYIHMPRKTSVILFDEENSDFLKSYLEHGEYEILHTRGERIYAGIWVRAIFEKNFFRLRLRSAYNDAFIRYVQPSLIITGIDNNLYFYTIAPRFPNIKTAFIQSSKRNSHRDIFGLKWPQQSYHVDYQFVYGRAIGDYYRSRVSGESIPIGSVPNNAIPLKQNEKPRYSLTFISQWKLPGANPDRFVRPSQETYMAHSTYYEPDRFVFEALLDWAEMAGIQDLNVLCLSRANRLEANTQERRFFQRHAKSSTRVNYLFTKDRTETYQVLDQSSLVVSIDSTLGLESIARGNKTAMIAVRGTFLRWPDAYFGWPGEFSAEGDYWTSSRDKKRVFEVLDNVLSMSQADWNNAKDRSFDQVMAYSPMNNSLRKLLSHYSMV